MHITSFHVENFRRLRDVRVDLDCETTIFVGANNSGKTSATHVFRLFLGKHKGAFQLFDFTADCWRQFDDFKPDTDDPDLVLPRIVLDLWLEVDAANLHRVVDLLPGLDWSGGPVGVRMSYMPRDGQSLLANYRAARDKAVSATRSQDSTYRPWPQSLTDYLSKRLRKEYEIRYAVLDFTKCGADGKPANGYEPVLLRASESGLASGIESLIRVDFLNAQRHLTDAESHGRTEDLSRRLSSFYARNLQQRDDDVVALAAIADSETKLNAHFAEVFKPTLEKLAMLGYPGIANPNLVLKASFNVETILSSSARVHYALPGASDAAMVDDDATLPDQYNGLGFKNLIFMVIEVLDFHLAWIDEKGDRPAIHLVMIEEPEAHLHAQLQQVFIRKIREILPAVGEEFVTQMIVTTHSAHVIYEKTFEPIRYFMRAGVDGNVMHTDVRNLSLFHINAVETRDFLSKYLKLTHCDLFFADAAVLVEGNVERLLLPLIIDKDAPELRASHLTILEVGGAFAHKFQKLVEFLGLPTLVITDLDSVIRPPNDGTTVETGRNTRAKACMTTVPAAQTSNATLKIWLPKIASVEDLLELSEAAKCPPATDGSSGHVRVAYQTRRSACWGETTEELAGRTFEEAFALQNLAWCQAPEQRDLDLYIDDCEALKVAEIHQHLFERIKDKDFDKTAFALGVILKDPRTWTSPQYIVDGLAWLCTQLFPPADPVPRTAAALIEVHT